MWARVVSYNALYFTNEQRLPRALENNWLLDCFGLVGFSSFFFLKIRFLLCNGAKRNSLQL